MKIFSKTLILTLLLSFAAQSASAESCLDLEKGKESQMKRLETAKTKIFEQDINSIKLIKEKQALKIVSIKEKTVSRVLELEIILTDLKKLPEQSETVLNTINTLSENIALYAKDTEYSLTSFASSTDKVLDDKSKAVRSVVQQYEVGVIQLYDKAIHSCKKNNMYNEKSFDQELKSAQKRVLDAEKNSKRIVQGIDSLYASLSLDLDASDTSLNLVLKSIQISLLENPPENLKPLSLFRLWRML